MNFIYLKNDFSRIFFIFKLTYLGILYLWVVLSIRNFFLFYRWGPFTTKQIVDAIEFDDVDLFSDSDDGETPSG